MDSKYTNLLTRQLKRYLKTDTSLTPGLKDLLDAINRSYEHYERDHALGKQSLEISTQELLEAGDALKAKEYFLHSILEAASDGILVINENQKIEICNYIAARYLGFGAETELIGKDMPTLTILPSSHGLYELSSLKQPDGLPLTIELSTSEVTVGQKKLRIYILRDITLRKEQEQSQLRELQLQKQLATAARQIGMMEMATSVLHNVGNVLTTVNVSVGLLRENVCHTELRSLPKIANLIREHKDDLGTYIEKDPRGNRLPDLLIALSECWEKENQRNLNELDLLEKNVQHIKSIITVQQATGIILGIKEKVSINELLDELISMHSKEFQKYNVKIIREYAPAPEISIDRARLLQILVNLIRNALDSLKEKCPPQKQLIFRTMIKDKNTCQIELVDNGMGITSEHLPDIFSFGFTTKKEGHGFGLHTCALLAKEMGGKLSCQSYGPAKGATFTLNLQIQA